MKPAHAGQIHVVGGGIGGLAVAGGLLRQGFDVHVHEQAPSFAHVGGGHWLYANALRALQRLGPDLAPAMRARGHGFDGFHFATPRLETLFLESTTPYSPSPELTPVVMHRADIIDVLQSAVPPERLHFGHRLARARPGHLQFDNGDTTDVDLLIGADGIHSRVRPLVSDRRPAFSGQTGLWGISDHVLPEGVGRHFTELWSNGLRMGFTYVGGGGVYWFMVVRDEAVPDDDDARKAFILERAAPFPADLVQAVEKTDARRIATNPLWDMSPPPRWHTDTVCCLGDAVHPCTPNLGQGGCQALEDAACLTEMLTRHDTAEQAFAAFQRARWWRTFAVVHLSRNLGRLAQSRGPWAAVRNALVSWGPAWAPRPVLRWICG